jgi:Carboxypeptidase regulatory-like domain
MKKNEAALITTRAKVTKNYVGSHPGAKRTLYRPCILSAALVAFFSVGAWSQTQLATVFGTITDPSGAVVPGVSVTIVSQGTGLSRSAFTDTAGEYRFVRLADRKLFSSHRENGIPITDSRRS